MRLQNTVNKLKEFGVIAGHKLQEANTRFHAGCERAYNYANDKLSFMDIGPHDGADHLHDYKPGGTTCTVPGCSKTRVIESPYNAWNPDSSFRERMHESGKAFAEVSTECLELISPAPLFAKIADDHKTWWANVQKYRELDRLEREKRRAAAKPKEE